MSLVHDYAVAEAEQLKPPPFTQWVWWKTDFHTLGPAYVAGPMTGYPNHNYPAFDEASKKLLDQGWGVISPASLNRARGVTASIAASHDSHATGFARCMRIDAHALLICTHIFMLKGWEKSRGARYELCLAEHLGLEVMWADDATPGTVGLVAQPQFGKVFA